MKGEFYGQTGIMQTNNPNTERNGIAFVRTIDVVLHGFKQLSQRLHLGKINNFKK